MHTQINTDIAMGATPAPTPHVSCDIVMRETTVSAVEQIDIASDLLDAALSMCEQSGTDLSGHGGRCGDQMTHQILVLIETSKKMFAPVRTALARGELGKIDFEYVHRCQPLLDSDPILDAIWNYTQGCAAFDSMNEAIPLDNDDAHKVLVEKTYGPSMDVLDNWTTPALTAKGAREALSFALQECTISGVEPRIENMIRAAYDFYASEGGVA